jgi:serine-type D-Ala-D-Ala carboxypeptidase (penicillin-binding protein 5/6)
LKELKLLLINPLKLCAYVILIAVSSAALAAPETNAQFAIIMDGETGATLFEKEADAVMYPASMTKMMTAYMLFDGLKTGAITEDTAYTVSETAWSKGGSKMFVQLGTSVAVKDLMRGIIVQSGNDACIVFAEGYAGSEELFAKRMTEKAREIGMTKTVFKNATGWPDDEHVTTARDLAMLGYRTVKDFPSYYPLYDEREFTYYNIRQYNRNLLLSRNIGVDGLKTGHTEAAGYGITISGVQEGRRVFVVVGGLDSEKTRADAAEQLYRYAYAAFDNVALDSKTLTSVPLWYGEKGTIAVSSSDKITLPVTGREQVKITYALDSTLVAPIEKGQKIGTATITSPEISQQKITLVAAESVAKAGFLSRLITNIKHLMGAV